MLIALVGAPAQATRPADAAVLQQRARHHAARAGAQRTRAARQVEGVREQLGQTQQVGNRGKSITIAKHDRSV